jgi:regulator of protease activity HflC (stomatin/prohibitin superfamily)
MLLILISGCSRIEQGEVGLRIDFTKQVNLTELQPGTLNQTLIGSVKLFPVRELSVNIDDMHPQTRDNSILADFDAMIVYSISPDKVGELYTTKSKGFNEEDENGDILLMYKYIKTVVTSSINKSIRKYDVLELADKRQAIENDVLEITRDTLKAEGLDTSILITQVQVKNTIPAQSIIDSANAVVRARNELIVKDVEINIAKKESDRQTAIASGVSDKALAYMNANANIIIANAVHDGKVQTILIPHSLNTVSLALSK